MREKVQNVVKVVMLVAAMLCAGTVQAKKHGASSSANAEASSSHGVVNINTASEAQLRLLPRIGPSKARAIVAYRSKRPFKATWDLIRVKGIGKKTFRNLKPFLAVRGETTLTEKIRLKKQAKKNTSTSAKKVAQK